MKISQWPGNLGFLGTFANERLSELNETEVAVYGYDEGEGASRRARLLVASDGGLLDVVEAAGDPAAAGTGADVWQTEAEFHSWATVAGARFVFTRFPADRGEITVHLSLAHPQFDRMEVAVPGSPLARALTDFGSVCAKHAGWRRHDT